MEYKLKVEIIYDYISSQKLTKAEFCKQCNIGVNTLRKLLAKESLPTLVTLFNMARLINVGIADLIEEE